MSKRRIQLEGALYKKGGRLSQTDWDTVHRNLSDWGAEPLYHNKYPDFFIAGAGSRSKKSQALARGIPVIDEDTLLVAMDQGYFDYSDRFIDEDLTLDQAIAELRSTFDGEPTSESWTTCLELIERCPDEQFEPVFHYISQDVDRWTTPSDHQWSPSADHALLSGVPSSWIHSVPHTELRVCPPIWLYEMTRSPAQYHKKHELIRAISCDEMRLNLSGFKRILKNPHLINLRIMNLGIRNTCTEKLISQLASFSAMEHVEELWIHDMYYDTVRWLDQNKKTFPNITTIRVRGHRGYGNKDLEQRFNNCACFPQEVSLKPLPYTPPS